MLLDTALLLLALTLLAAVALARLRHTLSDERQRSERLESELDAARRRHVDASGKLEAVLSASSDAILFAASDGRCQPMNSRARALFPGNAMPGPLLAMTQSPELEHLLLEAQALDDEPSDDARESSESELPIMGEVILHAAGELTMQVLISRERATNGHLILLRDITDLRRLETVRRDFVANVSHELRTPLSSVKAMAETLLDGALEDEGVARHFLQTIIRETDRLVRLAADLLDLSRIETRPVLKEERDIAVLVDDIITRLASQRSKAGLTLTLDLDRPLMAPCDSDEIAQVLVNLLDNAIKYTPRGGVVNIAGHLRRGRVVIEVSDTGIGILQQDLPRLFERFYRTDKARSRQSGGTGLGLSIVKHIVERHGGELWVRSEYNRGSTFGFSIPRASDHDDTISGRFERLQTERRLAPDQLRGEYVVLTGAAAKSEPPAA